ncbi:MAG: methylenetetrahydrofolate reductase [NAD(P)H] [Candidatus Dadabacteria bacterium]|nr:MAG: methylenetetrahydrofolate reductase [NAD(P)H] [Candidatus Dadabacteria bacterium]
MTVTYGAGGGTRDKTFELVRYIKKDLAKKAVAHLTCAGHSKDEINSILQKYKENSINYILALRGDPPKGESKFIPHPDGFSCARDLVSYIRENFNFSIAVAGYPETHKEAVSPQADIDYLKEKVDAGAELIVTQLFFSANIYNHFIERVRKAGINVPVLPGIMPISNYKQLIRFTTMCGASVPAWISNKLEQIKDNRESVIKFGIDQAVSLCRDLLKSGAPGIHLYTLNKSAQVEEIVKILKKDALL